MLTLSSVTIGSRLNERTHEPSAVSLFLYNAVIWNPHRIHFDEPYTTQIEKHPGLVVDGPLQGDWLSQAVMEWLGDDGELMQLEYSNRRAAYLGERLRSGGEVVEIDTSGIPLELPAVEAEEAERHYIVATNLFRRCLPTTYRGGIATFGGLCERFATDRYCTKEHFPSEKTGLGIN